MKVVKVVFNIFLILCGVCFVALSGYYIYEISVAVRHGSQILNIVLNALAALMQNLIFINICLACAFSVRKMFLNVFIMSATSFAITILQFVLSLVMRSSCNKEDSKGYATFCSIFMDFAWIGPVIADFVINLLTSFFSLLRFGFYNSWEWD
ncbi:hypothetical protein EIN_526350 [Entamoeba invadens IP1]|uniref:Transmembrane protein n=1 Tax=Entamoeba invadens IP1 TaxID=370355 RepID=A0A0A1U5S9_ENTIV|nr:hypothetical protein EIN_526350 [Entamoeba invadens IP1]ELP89610.1 hypothetical protein EIN_526350 [Entamoeba invadens IP1]|eukprot:XP_004256381.1 hypothetical protein EIN_526350 [Entamoeba invadens IP1]